MTEGGTDRSWQWRRKGTALETGQLFWSCHQQQCNRCSISVRGREKTQSVHTVRRQHSFNLFQNTENYKILVQLQKEAKW